MLFYFIFLFLLRPYQVTSEKLFHLYKPIAFRQVSSVQEVDNVTPGFTNIYVRQDGMSSRFKISFFEDLLSVTVVKSDFSDIIAPNSRVKVFGEKMEEFSTSNISVNRYVGRVLDSPGSFVHGIIHNHVFSGIIQTKSKTFYVEPYNRYFNGSETYNAIIYEHVDPYIRYCENYECDLVLNKTTKRRHAQVSKPSTRILSQDPRHASTDQFRNLHVNSAHQKEKKDRIKGKACEVVAVADHTYYEFHVKTLSTLIEEMTGLISAVNREFEKADFNGDGEPDQLSIVYAGTEVYKRASGRWSSGLSSNLTQQDLLLAFSRLMKDNPYCLAILFTARDFHPEGGLGLAFTAVSSPRGPDGGICSPSAKYGKPISGRARLNTLLVSVIHNRNIVPFSSMVTNLLHQIGHSFGSHHDPMSERLCTPNDEAGDFIMYPELHQEKLPNSRKFSTCSISRMLPVIRNKGWCLIDRTQFSGGKWKDKCGNGVLDDEERCDCGLPDTCDELDPCCRPHGGASPCTLLPGVMCSPSADTCCSLHCTFKDAGEVCAARKDPECSSYGICAGSNACIHMRAEKGNLESCGHGRGQCLDGVCQSNICKENNLEPCQCEQPFNHRCHVCCIDRDETCKSAFEIGIMDENGKPFLMPIGRTCYEETGICNRFGACEVIVKQNVTDHLLFGYRRRGVKTNSGWFPNNIAFILIALVLLFALILIILGLIVNWRRTRMLTRFRASCMESKRRIKEGGEEWDELFGQMRVDEWTKNRIIRLYALFPHATAEQIISASEENTEQEAVELLLEQDIPIRKDYKHPWPPGTLIKKSQP